ncbi:MAG: guanylate kinase [Isosphaeraceae bacterium]|nr:guanylate kinase [Isosphaeraceae bacterium]
MWVEGYGDLPGHLVVVSGPSGSGKSTLLRRALQDPRVKARLSVSATTRPPRPGEREGIDYYFMDPDEFAAARARGEFLECAEFNQHWYGTPARPVFEAMKAGDCVVLEIEVKGALQVREKAPSALFVFIDVPRFSELERRLRARGTESEAALHRRLVRARWELEHSTWYDVRIVNDDLDQAVACLVHILAEYGHGE